MYKGDTLLQISLSASLNQSILYYTNFEQLISEKDNAAAMSTTTKIVATINLVVGVMIHDID